MKEQWGSHTKAPAASNSTGRKTGFQDWTSRKYTILLQPPIHFWNVYFHENSTAENISELSFCCSVSPSWTVEIDGAISLQIDDINIAERGFLRRQGAAMCCEKGNKNSSHPPQTCCLEDLVKIPENQAETVHTSATIFIQQFNISYCECCNCYLLANIRTNTLVNILICPSSGNPY